MYEKKRENETGEKRSGALSGTGEAWELHRNFSYIIMLLHEIKSGRNR